MCRACRDFEMICFYDFRSTRVYAVLHQCGREPVCDRISHRLYGYAAVSSSETSPSHSRRWSRLATRRFVGNTEVILSPDKSAYRTYKVLLYLSDSALIRTLNKVGI